MFADLVLTITWTNCYLFNVGHGNSKRSENLLSFRPLVPFLKGITYQSVIIDFTHISVQ